MLIGLTKLEQTRSMWRKLSRHQAVYGNTRKKLRSFSIATSTLHNTFMLCTIRIDVNHLRDLLIYNKHKIAPKVSKWLQGRTYLCKKLDLQTKIAVVRPVDVKYYTSIREHQDIFVVGGSAVYPSPEVLSLCGHFMTLRSSQFFCVWLCNHPVLTVCQHFHHLKLRSVSLA